MKLGGHRGREGRKECSYVAWRKCWGENYSMWSTAARWWDDEVKAKIEHRRELYRKIASGQELLHLDL